jgi:anthranilate phosphoribosyltransferase
MTELISNIESPIIQGIKTIGIGKKGSKPLSKELIEEIILELEGQKVEPVVQGAFFGALWMKGLTQDEQRFQEIIPLNNPIQLAKTLTYDAPEWIQDICIQLLRQETLDKKTAKEVGQFLFSNNPGDSARGMIASILRVRYETPEEYEGLLESMNETFDPEFKIHPPINQTLIQIAEPFDGVDQSNIITPLLAKHIQEQFSTTTISLVGRNSGPKYGNNLQDIAQKLNGSFLKNSENLKKEKPLLGWYLSQQDLSKPLDAWVELRRQIIKRPFLSTLERFVNPLHAEIIIASAFHPPYGEKMLTICERAGYKGAIIVRNGLEGGIAFPLKRPAKILCTAQQKDGTYLRHEFEYWAEKEFNISIAIEEKLENPSLDENIRLIQKHLKEGKSDYDLFDYRVQATCTGITNALSWINQCLKIF